jgi:hypothetical protein
MAHQDEPAAALDHGPDARQGEANPPVVGDHSLLVKRDVEIHPHQDALAGDVHLLDRFLLRCRLRRCWRSHLESTLFRGLSSPGTGIYHMPTLFSWPTSSPSS